MVQLLVAAAVKCSAPPRSAHGVLVVPKGDREFSSHRDSPWTSLAPPRADATVDRTAEIEALAEGVGSGTRGAAPRGEAAKPTRAATCPGRQPAPTRCRASTEVLSPASVVLLHHRAELAGTRRSPSGAACPVAFTLRRRSNSTRFTPRDRGLQALVRHVLIDGRFPLASALITPSSSFWSCPAAQLAARSRRRSCLRASLRSCDASASGARCVHPPSAPRGAAVPGAAASSPVE